MYELAESTMLLLHFDFKTLNMIALFIAVPLRKNCFLVLTENLYVKIGALSYCSYVSLVTLRSLKGTLFLLKGYSSNLLFLLFPTLKFWLKKPVIFLGSLDDRILYLMLICRLNVTPVSRKGVETSLKLSCDWWPERELFLDIRDFFLCSNSSICVGVFIVFRHDWEVADLYIICPSINISHFGHLLCK